MTTLSTATTKTVNAVEWTILFRYFPISHPEAVMCPALNTNYLDLGIITLNETITGRINWKKTNVPFLSIHGLSNHQLHGDKVSEWFMNNQ